MNLTHIAAALAATVDSTVIRNLDGYDRLDLDPKGPAFLMPVLMLSSGEQTVIRSAQRLQLIGLDLDYLKAAAVLNGVTS